MMLIKPEILTSSQETVCALEAEVHSISQQTRNHLYWYNYSIECSGAPIHWKSFTCLTGLCIKSLFQQIFVCGIPLYTCQSRALRVVDISDLLGNLSLTSVLTSMLWSWGKHRLACRNDKICTLEDSSLSWSIYCASYCFMSERNNKIYQDVNDFGVFLC